MKTKAFCLIVQMIITLILTFSVVGMLLFAPHVTYYRNHSPDIQKSTWMELGITLLDSVLNDK